MMKEKIEAYQRLLDHNLTFFSTEIYRSINQGFITGKTSFNLDMYIGAEEDIKTVFSNVTIIN